MLTKQAQHKLVVGYSELLDVFVGLDRGPKWNSVDLGGKFLFLACIGVLYLWACFKLAYVYCSWLIQVAGFVDVQRMCAFLVAGSWALRLYPPCVRTCNE